MKIVKCPKCGKINDEDAQFCEDCGTQLQSKTSSGMASSTKVLIVALIVLVCILGFLAGYLLNNNKTTVNQTNATLNVTNNTTNHSNQTTENVKSYISASEAIAIANSIAAGYAHASGKVDFVDTLPGNPYYKVYLEWDDPKQPGWTYLFIDAVTGEVRN